jgi:hypothetical protein
MTTISINDIDSRISKIEKSQVTRKESFDSVIIFSYQNSKRPSPTQTQTQTQEPSPKSGPTSEKAVLSVAG